MHLELDRLTKDIAKRAYSIRDYILRLIATLLKMIKLVFCFVSNNHVALVALLLFLLFLNTNSVRPEACVVDIQLVANKRTLDERVVSSIAEPERRARHGGTHVVVVAN